MVRRSSHHSSHDNASARARGPGRPPGGGDSKQAILDAAVRMFMSDGLSASLRDIAEEAGVTQAAIYHYFPGKEDLLGEAAASASQLFERIGARAVPEGGPEDVLRGLAETYLATFDRPHVARLMVTMLSAGVKMPGFLPTMAERLHRGVLGPTITYLENLQREGIVGSRIDPTMATQMLFGTCFSFMMARHVLKAPWVHDMEPGALAQQIAHVLIHGMGGTGTDNQQADSDSVPQPGDTPHVQALHRETGGHDEMA